MGVSLKKAASQLLKWNLEGQKHARAVRGHWVQRDKVSRKCTACKVGLVMIGRYGLEKAVDYNDGSRLRDTLKYGPLMRCPIRGCDASGSDFRGPVFGIKQPLGSIIEHLFEHHKRSVMWIDKWLAGVAEEELIPA